MHTTVIRATAPIQTAVRNVGSGMAGANRAAARRLPAEELLVAIRGLMFLRSGSGGETLAAFLRCEVTRMARFDRYDTGTQCRLSGYCGNDWGIPGP
jgi:hypothetical protein